MIKNIYWNTLHHVVTHQGWGPEQKAVASFWVRAPPSVEESIDSSILRAHLPSTTRQHSGIHHLSERWGESLEEQGIIRSELRHEGLGASIGHQMRVDC